MKRSCIKTRSPGVIMVKCSDSLNAAWWSKRLLRALQRTVTGLPIFGLSNYSSFLA